MRGLPAPFTIIPLEPSQNFLTFQRLPSMWSRLIMESIQLNPSHRGSIDELMVEFRDILAPDNISDQDLLQLLEDSMKKILSATPAMSSGPSLDFLRGPAPVVLPRTLQDVEAFEHLDIPFKFEDMEDGSALFVPNQPPPPPPPTQQPPGQQAAQALADLHIARTPNPLDGNVGFDGDEDTDAAGATQDKPATVSLPAGVSRSSVKGKIMILLHSWGINNYDDVACEVCKGGRVEQVLALSADEAAAEVG
jgi:hypothetical protein